MKEGTKKMRDGKCFRFILFNFFAFISSEIEFQAFACVYLMCRNDITKSSFINCSNSVDDAKWRKENGVYFSVCFPFYLMLACLFACREST